MKARHVTVLTSHTASYSLADHGLDTVLETKTHLLGHLGAARRLG